MRDALVVDSSAVIAEIKNEPGAIKVRQIMAMPPKGGCFMHAISVCEVAYHLIKNGLSERDAYELSTPEGVAIIDDIRPVLWKRTASLKARYKNLALGDCIVVALAEVLNADILTGDRDFGNVDTDAEIRLFR